MGIEFELKYRATEESQAALRETGTWHSLSMVTTYYDTPTAALSRRHITLRRRLENGVSVCTLKTPAGALGRGEWEVEAKDIETAVPVLCKLGCPGLLPLLREETLIPVCGARFTRLYSTLQLRDTVLELALDRGVLFSGSREAPLCEVEVELKAGSRQQALAFGRDLASRYGLTEEHSSKFKRALALREEA